jgi:hypothetical protein
MKQNGYMGNHNKCILINKNGLPMNGVQRGELSDARIPRRQISQIGEFG